MTAGEVMDLAATLLNDTAKTLWNYTKLIGPLRVAYAELNNELKVHGLPQAGKEALITVGVNATTLGLPSDFSTPLELHERDSGSTDPLAWREITQKRFLPDETPSRSLNYWQYQEGAIKFLGATSARQVRLRYLKNLNALAGEASIIDIPDSLLVLAARTAGLAADFNGRMPSVADRLNGQARQELDRFLRPQIKEQQNLPVRRGRFRSRR